MKPPFVHQGEIALMMLAVQAAKHADILTLNQLVILLHLATKEDGDYPTRLAPVIGSTVGAITGIVAKLVRLGLAQYEPQDLDRRAKRVRITEKGSELVTKMLP